MLKRFGLVVVAGAGLGLAAPVFAQVSKAVEKCEDGTGLALSKFVSSEAKCISKCIATQRKASSPAFGSCFSPFADPTTNACVFGSPNGASTTAQVAIDKVCGLGLECPVCYAKFPDSEGCSGIGWVDETEANFDGRGVAPLVYCVENGGMMPSTADAKCEDGVSKALVKFIGAKTRCYQRCNDNMNKGKIPQGSCTASVPSDMATLACISGAEAKNVAALNKACPSFPSCYGTFPVTALDLTSFVEGIQDSQMFQIYCGSPSGAFLN
jgi:hypothetical protein